MPVLLRAAAELARARLALTRITPRKVQDLNQSAACVGLPSTPPDEAQTARCIAFVIPRVAALLPWRADCLIQAIAAQRWLRRQGVTSQIVIGTKRGDDGEFLAHAWLKLGDRIITGGDVSSYVTLLARDDST